MAEEKMQKATTESVHGTAAEIIPITTITETITETTTETIMETTAKSVSEEAQNTADAAASGADTAPDAPDDIVQNTWDGKQMLWKFGRFAARGFRKFREIYSRSICTYSNMMLIGAALLLCLSGAFSQAAFGILVLLYLICSVRADQKEKKRVESALMAEEDRQEEDRQEEDRQEVDQEENEVIVIRRKSKLERSLDTYGRRIGAVMLVLSLILFIQSFMFRYESFQSSVVSMCSAFVAAMPIGLYLLRWLADFIGAVRFSKQGLNVQEKRAVTRFAETDVLCITNASLLNETESAAISKLQECGVRVVVVSEEEPEGLLAKSKQAGVAQCTEPADASELTDVDSMRKAILRCAVIGNATPLQKGMFVTLLQESGKLVTVAGKEKKDSAAIRHADVSIAFAPQEEKAARLADVTVQNEILDVLSEAYDISSVLTGNIQHLSGLFFMKNISALLLAVYAVLRSVSYPVTLSMWNLLGIFTIGIPAILLLFGGNEERKEKFLFAAVKKALPAAVTGTLAAVILFCYGAVFGLNIDGTITAVVMVLALAGFLMLGEICLPMSVSRILMIVVCVLGFLCGFALCKPIFGMAGMNTQIRLLLALFLIAEESFYRMLKWLKRKKKASENQEW